MKKYFYMLLLAIVSCCWSCSGGEEELPSPTPKPDENPQIQVTSTAPVLPQEGGTASVTFTSTANWTIDVTEGRAVSWCTVSPTSGSKGTNTLTITTTGNDTYDERNAKVTIKAGVISQSFTVTQKQKDALIVTSNKVEINAEGGNFSIEAQTNVDITYEIEESAKEWISTNESRGLSTKTLNFTANANEDAERRQGNIILKGGDGLTEIVTVYQEGEKPALVITNDDIIVGSEGESIKIELKSNVDYTMVMPDVDWISKEDSRAFSAYTHYLSVAPNETYDQRSAVVFFQNESEGLKDSINITQLQKDAIIVAKNEYIVSPESGNLDFSVATNVDFEVSISVDWIQQNTSSRGLVEKPLSFTIAENESKESREGEIVITFDDLKQTIKVKQNDFETIERAVLIDFYKATNGDKWKDNTNWCSDKPISEWAGVTVTNDRVKALHLMNNNLNGLIPNSIGCLAQLEVLRLNVNNLKGTIPDEIGKLKKLKELFLGSNSLGGIIPESIFYLKNLTYLDLQSNNIEGTIPETIENCTKLHYFNISSNKISGNIPESIGNCTNLAILWLLGNQLTGYIPESIGNLKRLTEVSLGGNLLTGNIPSSIGNLSRLKELTLTSNQLEGNIPSSIGNLTSLRSLSIVDNNITGSIPESIGNMSSLQSLWLQENQLTGNIPESIGNLTLLENLGLSYNQLTGNIPESIGNLTNLKILWLHENQLTGKIPESIFNHTVWKNWWQTILFGNNLDITGATLWGPDFEITDINGVTTTSEKEYTNNKLTVLYTWSSLCGNSRSFNKKMIKLYDKYKDRGVEIIGLCSISVSGMFSSEEKETAYIKNNKIPWRNYIQSFEIGGVNNISSATFDIIPAIVAIDGNKKIVFQTLYGEHYKRYEDFERFLADYIGEESPQLYTSTDYSQDGEVVVLQEATIGNGINLTYIGEAFVDKDMSSGGIYEEKMKEAMEGFFSIEPYKSMRDRFNVYAVKVVSPNAEFTQGAKHRINQDKTICFEYALKIPNADQQPLMVSVVYNNYSARSFCQMYSDGSFVSYIMQDIEDGSILHHESGGHGFGQLFDEYVENGNVSKPLSEEECSYLDNVWAQYNWGANVDWRNAPSTVKWAHMLSDERYSNQDLGIYEGAYLYGLGVYRSSYHSMMRYNNAPFNAPSREAIYKRIMKLSEGENWKYDYEEFVEFDEKNRKASSRSVVKPLTETEKKEYAKKHCPPTLIKGTWRDAIKNDNRNIVVPFR